jgi:hypothetical protein
MKRELTVYYISRAVLSALLAVLLVGQGGLAWWSGVILGMLLYGGFLYYAHSGHYLIDPGTPLIPLRRDERAGWIRDRALAAAVAIGGMSFAALSLVGSWLPVSVSLSSVALALGIVTYFGVSEWLLARR